MRLIKRDNTNALAGIGVLGAASTAKTMIDAIREVSFDEIRDEATRTPRFLVLASTSDEAEQIALLLTGAEDLRGVGIGTSETEVWNAASYDAVVVHDPLNSGTAKRIGANQKDASSIPVVVNSNVSFDQAEAHRVRQQLAGKLDERALAFARSYPAFRGPVISKVINDSSTANAQFAFVSNIPALIPVVGGFLSAGADMILLTKNQLMMVYKIAAASGRKLDDQHAIIREMVPVVGTGFLWRTAAREAAAFLPVAAGAIPKVAIAFSGTYALGRAAEVFYRFGEKPSKEQRAEFYAQARELLTKLPFGKRGKEQAIIETTASLENERPQAAD